MTKPRTGTMIVLAAVLSTATLSAQPLASSLMIGFAPQNENRLLAGHWTGSRSERIPETGATFAINFEFEFRRNGIYVQKTYFGTLPILEVRGQFMLRRGQKTRSPAVTHVLDLNPASVADQPGEIWLRALQLANLPNIVRTQQFVAFYNLNTGSAASLQDTQPGSEAWGLQRVPSVSFLSSLLTATQSISAEPDSSLIGTWRYESSSLSHYEEIILNLRADGTYTKRFLGRVSAYAGSPAGGGTHDGRWTANGSSVHLSGDGNWPASNHDLRSFRKLQ